VVLLSLWYTLKVPIATIMKENKLLFHTCHKTCQFWELIIHTKCIFLQCATPLPYSPCQELSNAISSCLIELNFLPPNCIMNIELLEVIIMDDTL
jgi:hypothetical protein